ncbi:hypothetical protein DFH05DRAFT_1203984 [Lentinula detonsa]|uniref:Pentatricopeptide repeat-containing protein n=1 Tax=Lentinula detonsa TaxID=2804962 RepID=A0A9W8TWH2_9AGAR|nr:hypothetical protein DFH05DRAFT_1203984 [Lentinula detonsa]
MLRASSLGPIFSSTCRICLEQCQRPHQVALSQYKRQSHTARMSTSEHGDARESLPNVYAPGSTTTKDFQSQNPQAVGKDALKIENTNHTATKDPKVDLIQAMLQREREGWKAEKNQDSLYVRQALPYTTGKSPSPIPPLYGGKFKCGSYKIPSALRLHADAKFSEPTEDGQQGNRQIHPVDAFHDMSTEDVYYHFCHVIAKSTNVEDAWSAYSTILTIPSPKDRRRGAPPVPFEHLHRLCRLLSRNQPRTRTQFLRLLSILYTLRKYGGMIHRFEWNALIANAGTGWRGSKAKDFKLSLDVFDDMVSGEPPGSSFSVSDYPPLATPPHPIEPDIYTYNTLISIASKTLYGRAIGRATSMLRASGYSPDRITHLSLLVYFTHTNQLAGVRSTLLKMRQQNLELGLDGINACIWAFGRNGKLEWADDIYRVLRHNTHPEPSEIINPIIKALKDEYIEILPIMTPNATTFSTMIQLMAWNGHLTRTYSVLMEMLSSFNMEPGAPLVREDDGEIHYTTYTALYTSFRSLFLGFSRHGVYLRNDFTSRLQDRKWTISNLRAIFDTYISLPDPIQPSVSMVYWIMVAYDRTSNHDVEVMREVWRQLERQFKGPWGGPQHRLRVLREILFSSNAEAHLRKFGFRTAKREPRSPFTYKYDTDS